MKKSICVVVLVALFSIKSLANNNELNDYFESIKGDSTRLSVFLKLFPKGADLHTHLDGAIYAEDYLRWAAEDGKCITKTEFVIVNDCQKSTIAIRKLLKDEKLYNQAIDALSIRNYHYAGINGHDKFFSTFVKFAAAITGREAEMLAAVTENAAANNVSMLELQVVFGMFEVAQLAMDLPAGLTLEQQIQFAMAHPQVNKIVAKVSALIDSADTKKRTLLQCSKTPSEAACDVGVFFHATILRFLPIEQVIFQAVLAYQLVAKDARFVGVNIAGAEDNRVALESYKTQMQIFALLNKYYPQLKGSLAMHAGELKLGLVKPEHLTHHITDAVTVAGAKRIGHGVSIAQELPYHAASLQKIKANKVAIEVNLTSNRVILAVAGEQHPLRFYLQNAVPVVLGTDDLGIARIDLSHEFLVAVKEHHLSYSELKQLARNSLHYSFIKGKSLFTQFPQLEAATECSDYKTALSDECRDFIMHNKKAFFQYQFERKLLAFEGNIKNFLAF